MADDVVDQLFSTNMNPGTKTVLPEAKPGEQGDVVDQIFNRSDQPKILPGNQYSAWKNKYGLNKSPWVEVPLDIASGIGSGILNTAAGAMDLATGAGIIPRPKETEQSIQSMRGYAHDVSQSGSVPHYANLGEQVLETYLMRIPGFMENIAAKTPGLVGSMKRAFAGMVREGSQTGAISALQGQPAAGVGVSTALGALGGGIGSLAQDYVNHWISLTKDQSPEHRAVYDWVMAHGGKMDPAARTQSPLLMQDKKILSSGHMAPQAEEMTQQMSNDFGRMSNDIRSPLPPPQEGSVTGEQVMGGILNKAKQAGVNAGTSYGAIKSFEKYTGTPITFDRASLAQLPEVQDLHSALGATLEGRNSKLYQILDDIVNQNKTKITGQPPRTVQTYGQRTVVGSTTPQNPVVVNTQHTQRTSFPGTSLSPVNSSSAGTRTTHQGTTQWSSTRTIPGTQTMVNAGLPGTVNSETALTDLSDLYQAARKAGKTPQGIAINKIRNAYKDLVESTLNNAGGPSLVDSFREGAKFTKQKYDLQNVAYKLGGRYNPQTDNWDYNGTAVYNALTKDRGGSLPLLRMVQASDPVQLRQIGSSLANDIFTTAGVPSKSGVPTLGQTQYSNAATALRKWNSIDQRTKELLYPSNVIHDMDMLLNAGNMMQHTTVSGGGGSTAALSVISRAFMLLRSFKTFAADTAIEYKLGQYLFSSQGPLSPSKMGLNPGWRTAAAGWTALTGLNPEMFDAKTASGQ